MPSGVHGLTVRYDFDLVVLASLSTFYCCCCCLQLTDPFLSVFRGIIPPVGGIDLSVSEPGVVKHQHRRMLHSDML